MQNTCTLHSPTKYMGSTWLFSVTLQNYKIPTFTKFQQLLYSFLNTVSICAYTSCFIISLLVNLEKYNPAQVNFSHYFPKLNKLPCEGQKQSFKVSHKTSLKPAKQDRENETRKDEAACNKALQAVTLKLFASSEISNAQVLYSISTPFHAKSQTPQSPLSSPFSAFPPVPCLWSQVSSSARILSCQLAVKTKN